MSKLQNDFMKVVVAPPRFFQTQDLSREHTKVAKESEKNISATIQCPISFKYNDVKYVFKNYYSSG